MNKTLSQYCELGSKDEVVDLIAKGEDVNQKDGSNRYPLHYASIGGYFEIVAMLLEKGAVVNCSTARGATPLHYASRGGRIECVQLLIDNGADVNCKDNSGSTPLHTALVCNETKCAIALIESYHADTNLTNSEGLTPLHLASARGLASVVLSLLEHGAKYDIRDSKERNTALSLLHIVNDKKEQQPTQVQPLSQDISKLFNINKNKEFSGVKAANNNNETESSTTAGSEDNSMKIDKEEDQTPLDKLYSDLTFLVENQNIYAHKCIVQARCPNFIKSFNPPSSSNNNTTIEIKDIPYKLALLFTEWIYTGMVESFEQSPSKSVDLSQQFQLLLLADKYQCKSLIDYCKDYISKNISDINIASIWSHIKKLPLSNRSSSIFGLVSECLVSLVKNWNIFTSTKTFSSDITRQDVVEIIKTISPLIVEIPISELKPNRANQAATNQAATNAQSKTPARSGRTSTQPQTNITTPAKPPTSLATNNTPKQSQQQQSQHQQTPSTSNSNAPYSDSMNEKNNKTCKDLVVTMNKKKQSLAFQNPVDPVAEGIPDYFDVIKNPMDLSTIKSKLESNKYSNIKEFAADVRLMYENAMTYNADSSPIWKYAKTLLAQFDQKFIEKFPNEKIPIYKQPQPIPLPTQNTNNNNTNNNTPTTDRKRKLENENVRVKEDTASAASNVTNTNYTNGENASNKPSSSNASSTAEPRLSQPSGQKRYSDEERRNLMERIYGLEQEDVQSVLGIIDPSAILKQADESLEIDMYQIDDRNLSQVETFINECFKKQKQQE